MTMTKKIVFKKKKVIVAYKEDPLTCDKCGSTTYPNEQGDLWQHGYFAYCYDCRTNFK